MARVSIENDAFGDIRYETLARSCGLADADHARGKMARIWRQCTTERRYVLSAEDVESVLGENGVDALERARLGEKVDGGIRIRGTKGRIEWLENIKKNAKKGGKAKAAKRQENQPARRQASGSAKRQASGTREICPLTLTLTPTLTPAERETEAAAPPDPTHTRVRGDRLMALTERALVVRYQEELKLHGELRLNTPRPTLNGSTPSEADARKAIQSWMLEAPHGTDPELTVDERLAHLIAVRAAVARSLGHTKFWAPSTFWAPDGIARDLRQTPDQAVNANQGRDGQRGNHSAAASEPRRIPTL